MKSNVIHLWNECCRACHRFAFNHGKSHRLVSWVTVICLLSVLLFSSLTVQAQTIRYVGGATASPGGDGLSWATASTDLQRMINVSSAGDMIYVTQGKYVPIYDADGYVATGIPSYIDGGRNNAFVMKDGVRIYGGFAGTEATHTARTGGASILSGDIDGDGMLNAGNAYHVVISSVIHDNQTTLDGFTVTGGYANGSSTILVNAMAVFQNFGGGIYNRSSVLVLNDVTINENYSEARGGGIFSDVSTPVLTTVTISNNATNGDGGGMYNFTNSSPVLTDVIIRNNRATGLSGYGGGLYNYNNSSPQLTRVTITENNAINGGGVTNATNCSPTFSSVTINNNVANDNGGGIYNTDHCTPQFTNVIIDGNSASVGGGMYNHNYSSSRLLNVSIRGNNAGTNGGGMYNYTYSSPSLINVLISGNSADNNGGGIRNIDNSSPVLVNVTISGNRSLQNGGGIANDANSDPVLYNCIIWGNIAVTGVSVHNTNTSIPQFSNSLIAGSGGSGGGWNGSFGSDLGNNIDDDPLFVNWQDPSSVTMPTIAGDYRIQTGSPNPAIDTGDDSYYLAARSILSLAGETDLAGNARLFSTQIDMGAYESPGYAYYLVTIINGTGSGYRGNTETVSITADTPMPGMRFLQWDVQTGGATLASVTNATTTFTMPPNAVDIEADFETVIDIVQQPNVNTTVWEGAITESLSIIANDISSGGQTLNFQWYSNLINSNSGGSLIAGATNATLTIPPTLTAALSPYYYYCVVGATGNTTNLTSQVATVTVLPPLPVAPAITGPATMTLVVDYSATASPAFTITGDAPIMVTAAVSDSRITWDNATKCLNIAAGLPTGNYQVILTATNGVLPNATFTFTLTVAPRPTYSIIIQPSSFGKITANKTTAQAGETIFLTITPSAGYELASISATSVTLNGAGMSTRTFTMPDYDVTVTATFQKSARQLAWEQVMPLIEMAFFTVTQEKASDENTLRYMLTNLINDLLHDFIPASTGIPFTISPYDIVIYRFEQATSGTADTRMGINGLFRFRVSPSDVTPSAYSEGAILATPYSDVSNETLRMQNGALKAWVQNGVLHITGLTPGTGWSVYDLNGTLVYRGIANDIKAAVPLPARGMYIVTDGTYMTKVVL